MKKEKIFLIHGLFMHGALMIYMRHQLEKCGYEVKTFSYSSLKNSMSENTEKLVDYVRDNTQEGVTNHFVGHSLGGLLIRLAYECTPEAYTGNIVTLGTPHNGSLVAKRVAQDIHRAILGGAYDNALDGELPPWAGKIPLGSIAGTKCIGIGMALNELPRPNDGTVSVDETLLENQADHCLISLSHTALVYSSKVVQQTHYFLQHGCFSQQFCDPL